LTDLPRVVRAQPLWAEDNPDRARLLVQGLLGVGALALMVRVLVMLLSVGSNDMATWHDFAEQITQTSVGKLYDEHEYFNHPPLMGFFSSAAHTLSVWTSIRFDCLFKAPMILADVASAVLLYRRYRWQGEMRAALVFALFCANPVSILITAYHGNTDSLCASLSLLAAVLMDSRRVFLSGLALAAAINVKLIPVLLIAPLWSCVRNRKEALLFLAGASLGVIPFVPYLLENWPGFYKHVLAYRSSPRSWGITFTLFKLGSVLDVIGKPCRSIARFWTAHGFIGVLAWPVLLAILQRLGRPGWSACGIAAFSMLGFLVITPGWGVQYLVYPVALVFAVSIEQGVVYALVNGLLAFLIYAALWTGDVPLYSDFFVRGLPPQPMLFGIAAWLVVARVLYKLMRPHPEPRAPAGPVYP
jgi:GPI transamidase subunit PIG-U